MNWKASSWGKNRGSEYRVRFWPNTPDENTESIIIEIIRRNIFLLLTANKALYYPTLLAQSSEQTPQIKLLYSIAAAFPLVSYTTLKKVVQKKRQEKKRL